jgi:hypothetical protein
MQEIRIEPQGPETETLRGLKSGLVFFNLWLSLKDFSCSFSLEEKEPKESSENMLRIFGQALRKYKRLVFAVDE